jgi:hypothetical protein
MSNEATRSELVVGVRRAVFTRPGHGGPRRRLTCRIDAEDLTGDGFGGAPCGPPQRVGCMVTDQFRTWFGVQVTVC